jgi:alanine dehydrogenase
MLQTGIPGTSRKENERRVPIHPAHLQRIPPELRSAITLETGYGEPFGVDDERIRSLGFDTADRELILADSELVLLPKPLPEDLLAMNTGATLWGWPHAVQQRVMAQAAIDHRLTLLAFESMYHWSGDGRKGVHILYKNNELAGYCAILDALRLTGRDGDYGPQRNVVILSFGSVSRGAAHSLIGRGFTDVTALTLRPPHLVADQRFGVRFGQMERGRDGMIATLPGGDRRPLIDVLADADLIVNGTLQDPEDPLMFVRAGEEDRLRPRSLIVDVSCDRGMGFPFARPTSFEDPMFTVGDNVGYYAVDHTPSYLWEAASWEISGALLPYLADVMAGPAAWARNETLRRAVEIRDGVVENPIILSFQNRNESYPHRQRGGEG